MACPQPRGDHATPHSDLRTTGAVDHSRRAPGHGRTRARPVESSDARLKVGINATDGDAGLQIFLDGEAWDEVESDPQGNAMLVVAVTGPRRTSASPSCSPRAASHLSRSSRSSSSRSCSRRARTRSGAAPSTGRRSPLRPRSPTTSPTARRSSRRRPTRGCGQTVWWSSGHRSPLQPGSTSPAIRCSWSKKSRSCGSSALTCRRPPPGSRSSPSFVQPRTDYKVEVLAIAAGGNQTLTEITVCPRGGSGHS